MADTAAPAKTMRTGLRALGELESRHTSKMETRAPAKAPAGTDSLPSPGRDRPASMASTAPREAPEEMPST